MHHSQMLAMGLAIALGLISPSLVISAGRRLKPAGGATATQGAAQGMQCNGTRLLDPFKGSLAGRDLPPGVAPDRRQGKDDILKSGLPCQENVNPGAQGDTAGDEGVGLENLQRGFDFYSWRTFIALNSPADGDAHRTSAQADTPTRWEDMDNFKQLLDVMLPANLQPPKWPTDRAGMDAERERLMPEECSALHKQMPEQNDREDDRGELQRAVQDRPVDRPAGALRHLRHPDEPADVQLHHGESSEHQGRPDERGQFRPRGGLSARPEFRTPTFGAFMLKVSWKILSDRRDPRPRNSTW